MIESQIVSLDLSKQLDALGIKSKSVFLWEYYNDEIYAAKFFPYAVIPDQFDIEKNRVKIYQAYTVGDLLAMIPRRITLPKNEPYNSFCFNMKKSFIVKGMDGTELLKQVENYIVNYYCDTASEETAWLYCPMGENFSDINPANALAKMLINLIENKLIEIHQ